MAPSGFMSYWGKARPDDGRGLHWHPLAFHSLDVAAVGCALLQADPRLWSQLAKQSRLDKPVVARWLFLSLALHDIGKFAPAFQAKQPALFAATFEEDPWRGPSAGHDQDGRLLWGKHLKKEALLQCFAEQDAARSHHRLRAVGAWIESAICHHGRPRDPIPDQYLSDRFKPAHVQAVDEFVAAIIELAQTIGQAANERPPDQRVISWLVAGIAVLADWIGSNRAWFPYRAPETFADLRAYWHDCAMAQAVLAVREAGVIAALPAHSIQLNDLLPSAATAPSALQLAACDLALSEGPQLFVIEDQTGSGKTEAALALAGRLIAGGRGAGAFVALPTMATANAMYGRYARRDPPLYKRLFAAGAEPSIVLAHSRRDLFLREMTLGSHAEAGYGDGTETAGAACSAWLSDDRRKAALADCGIGTIDQAVMAVLPNRYQSLRLAGLARKVLIVDEVHAHEAYLRELVCGLLRFHAALGGSAILLSATLPASQRQRYLAAFAEGAGFPSPRLVQPDDAYPLLTRLDRDGPVSLAVAPRPDLERVLTIKLVSDIDEAIVDVQSAVRAGRAVCWIRNSVADAMEAYERLRRDVPTTLFHARFAMGDRLTVERDVLRSFGPDARRGERAGRVLVATQVAEQSLDLDFDDMVTDLAPIDSLMQRAGRLWRHARPGRAGCPMLRVVSPPATMDSDAAWYRRAFPRASSVYPNHAALWLTARELQRRATLRLPDDARALIEAVYGEGVETEVPEALQASWLNTEGRDHSAAATARSALLPLRDGYPAAVGVWQDDLWIPTRLGEPQSQIRLARWSDGLLRPWCEGDDWFAWRMSEVTVLKRWVNSEAPIEDPMLERAKARARLTWPDAHDRSLLIALVPDADREGVWTAKALDCEDRCVILSYDSKSGLSIRPGA